MPKLVMKMKHDNRGGLVVTLFKINMYDIKMQYV